MNPRLGAPVLIPLLAACASLILLAGCHDGSGRGGGGVTPPSPVFPMHQEEPAWSSTGLIAYRDNGIIAVSEEGGTRTDPNLQGLWIIDPVSGANQRISSFGRSPAWSPTASRIAFVHLSSIYTMTAAGDAQSRITDRYNSFFPSWSSDGARIAFDSNATGLYEIWAMNSDGSDRLLLVAPGNGSRMPHWSPNGTTLVFVGYETVNADVFTLDISTQEITRLTNDGRDYRYPKLSPDGNRIVSSALSPGNLPQLWLMKSNGSDLKQLTSSERGATWPSWSPTGTKIVYCSANTSRNDRTFGVLWIIDLTTGEERQLTTRWFD